MKLRTLLLTLTGLLISAALMAQVDPSQEVIVIPGGVDNGGSIETTINGDTLADGTRANPNRIYELEAGEFYLQHAAINVSNTEGTITIRGQEGGKKPIIVKQALNEVNIGTNQINSSLVVQNLYWQVMQQDNVLPWSHTNINGENHSLLVEDCLFEFCNGIIFNMNNVTAGAKATIRNSYFRDMQNGSGSQWWAGRVLQNKVPTDTLIFENNTMTGAGLTILPQECLIEYAVINHNTFINNRKYPCLNQYWKECYFTNNLFVNANWVGEDTVNVATGGQDPDALLHGIAGVDTITNKIAVAEKFKVPITDTTFNLTDDVDEISDYIFYAADNVCVASATLDNYYSGGMNTVIDGAPASYLDWGGQGTGPWHVLSVPGIWMNSRSEAMVADWDNLKSENNSIYEHTAEDLGFGTTILSQQGADILAQWNQNKWAVPDVESPTEGWAENVHFGDYDPTTIPGVETEDGDGITELTDLVEDFSYTMTLTSVSDGTPIGAHTWFDVAWDSEAMTQHVKNAYNGIYIGVEEQRELITSEFALRNYPNPFRNVTTISFNLPGDSHVNLSVYDISGRLVETLMDEHRIGGDHTVRFSPDFASSSTYFYRLTSDFGTETRKMMRLK